MTAHVTDVGFHEGEHVVQARAGMRDRAARLEGMLAPASLRDGLATFLSAQAFAVLVGRDDARRLWASPLSGRPGFLRGHDDVLAVEASPDPDDPLHRLPAGQMVGLIAPDLERRRRVRVNGRLSTSADGALTIDVAEAYGNCPSYITPRAMADMPDPSAGDQSPALEDIGQLTAEAARIVVAADTFFLGTQHPHRGADASHKGGDPWFVRIDGPHLVWPDYPGNNMFNSLGNLAVDPDAALLFLDFATSEVLQLSGTAEIEWRGSDRWVWFRPERGVGVFAE